MTPPARVLIADDDPMSRALLRSLLQGEGYAITSVASVEEALAAASREAPDVILMDVVMPDRDGFEGCVLLKSDSRFAFIPIILVTILSSTEQIVRGLSSGADEFLSKPINGPELRARVASMLRQKRQSDELREGIKLRDDLASLIVHDMRTPVMSILLYAQLLRRSAAEATERPYTDAIIASGQQLQEFTNDLLLLSKLEHGKLLLHRTPVDVGALLVQATEVCRALSLPKRVVLSPITVGDAPIVASVDARLTSRVLDNLLSNALKVSPEGGVVELRGERAENARGEAVVRISVVDQGPGIPDSLAGSLFEKFASVQGAAPVMGVGLGLYFVRMVVDAHGGTVSAEPNQPTGSRFVLDLPASSPPAPAAQKSP